MVKHKGLFVLLPVLFVLISALSYVFTSAFFAESNYEPITPEIHPVIPVIKSAQARFLFTGTTFWGRRTNAAARASELDVTYPFQNIDTLSPADYNAWIGNLECPITDNGHSAYDEETLLKFNCDPDYIPEVSKYFTAFSLGTNHVDNWGEEGITETKSNLKANGIQYFGSTKYDDGTENCNIIILPVVATFDNDKTEELSIPFGFCSAHGVFGIPTAAAFENIERYATTLPTIVMPHMGAEYQDSADQLRTNLYHRMIDLGAEAVLADHPHWIQNSEAYAGKLIVYSMGNFMFDQNFNQEVNRSAAIDATLTISEVQDLEAWSELGQACLERDGDCLELIHSSGLTPPQLSWSFDVVGTTTGSDFVVTIADQAGKEQILSRLNWASTLAGLSH